MNEWNKKERKTEWTKDRKKKERKKEIVEELKNEWRNEVCLFKFCNYFNETSMASTQIGSDYFPRKKEPDHLSKFLRWSWLILISDYSEYCTHLEAVGHIGRNVVNTTAKIRLIVWIF